MTTAQSTMPPAGSAGSSTATRTASSWAPWRAAGVLEQAIAKLVIDTGAGPEHDLWLRPGVRTPTGRCRVCWELAPIRGGMNAGAHRPPAPAFAMGSPDRCDGVGKPVLTRAEVAAGRAPAAGEQRDPAGPASSPEVAEREADPAGPAGGMTLEVVDLERLARHPLQPRHDVGDVGELAASIRQVGVLQPIVVGPDPAGGQVLRVLFGHRRWAAALRAGAAAVPVLIRWDLGSDAEQLMTMLAENLHRADLSPVEESEAYQQLRLLDVRPADIARGTGRRKDTVDRRLALSRLPAPVREQLHAGQVSIADADALVEFAADADVAGRLAGLLGTPEFRFQLEAERRRRDRRADVARGVRAARQAGVAVVRPQTPDWRWDAPTDGVPAVLGRLDVDDHAAHQADPAAGGCPGRALVVWDGDTQAAAACLQASRHGLFSDRTRGAPGPATPAGAGGVSIEQLRDRWAAEARERAAAEERLGEELATAAAVRGDWIRHLLAASTRPRRDQQLLMLRQALLYELTEHRDGLDALAGADVMLGIDLPTEPDGEAFEGWAAELETRVRAWPFERLVQAWWAVTLAEAHHRLAWPTAWRGELGRRAAAAFLADLQALGYVPAEVEARMLDQARPDAGGGG